MLVPSQRKKPCECGSAGASSAQGRPGPPPRTAGEALRLRPGSPQTPGNAPGREALRMPGVWESRALSSASLATGSGRAGAVRSAPPAAALLRCPLCRGRSPGCRARAHGPRAPGSRWPWPCARSLTAGGLGCGDASHRWFIVRNLTLIVRVAGRLCGPFTAHLVSPPHWLLVPPLPRPPHDASCPGPLAPVFWGNKHPS